MDGELAGGLYGVAMGRMFFGESMFSRQTDGSKIAIVMLAAQLADWGFPVIDCQMRTTHLATLGAEEISRRRGHSTTASSRGFAELLDQTLEARRRTSVFDARFYWLILTVTIC